MELQVVAGISALLVIIAIVSFLLLKKDRKAFLATAPNTENQKLQLQAYERLALLCERIALPNLISRLNVPNASAQDMQALLTATIREEFEFNISQQIYVSAESWNALKNLKEHNILIINQYALALPANATAQELNKLLLEYTITEKKGMMHEVVGDIINYEAKKIM